MSVARGLLLCGDMMIAKSLVLCLVDTIAAKYPVCRYNVSSKFVSQVLLSI